MSAEHTPVLAGGCVQERLNAPEAPDASHKADHALKETEERLANE